MPVKPTYQLCWLHIAPRLEPVPPLQKRPALPSAMPPLSH